MAFTGEACDHCSWFCLLRLRGKMDSTASAGYELHSTLAAGNAGVDHVLDLPAGAHKRRNEWHHVCSTAAAAAGAVKA